MEKLTRWMGLRWLLLMMVWVLGAAPASAAQWEYGKVEFIVVSGGPALRQWEDLRVKGDQHDRWWGNFIRSARIRMQAIRRAHGPEARLTWMVYGPAYRTRFTEDATRGNTGDDLGTMGKLLSVSELLNTKVVWYDSGDDIISYLNSRPRGGVADFEYFGHSNRHCFLFDYSNEISGVSVGYLHEDQLTKLSGAVFSRNATIKSWGCHTAESFSRKWKTATGVSMEGAEGKTDYSVICDHVSLPIVSAPGRWVP
jgi:hypothetical protein